MDTLAERLKKARKEAGLSQMELADKVGVTQAAIGKLERGKSTSSRRINQIAKALGVSVDWLLEGKGPKRALYVPDGKHLVGYDANAPGESVHLSYMPVVSWEKEEDLKEHGDYVFIPRIDLKADCGSGSCVIDEIPLDQRQSFRAEWFAQRGLKPQHAVCIYATGDSMEPRIYEGDTLLIDRSPATRENIIDGKIYLLRYGDDIRVKQLFKRYDGGLIIRSFNRDAYPDEEVPPDELEKGNIEILGRVVWIGSEL